MKHRLRDRHLKLEDKKQILQDDPYKLSIHSSANFNKSDSGSKRLNLSRMLENSRKKISMRKASELFQSGVRPHSSKTVKRNQVIEFDNMKWISIISAYDPTRLKNVSVSKKTCQKFFESQGQNIKSDSRSLLYFNDLIKNFKSWLNKIHIQYFYIMETFLYGKRSVNITLGELRPKIDEVINQTGHMQENLENCLKSYQNHEFRQLLKKYHAYLENSKQIENIIMVVNKSKTKITDLYKKFDDDKKIQQKLTRVKNDGIHEVKKIICQHNEVQIQNKIMERIQMAINEMAQKSGQAYRKIRGIKQLISKFKNTEHHSGQVMLKLDIDSINLMGKVCKQICFEADSFDAFSTKFLNQGEIINDDLKNIIKKYEQDMIFQRKRAIELQMKFLNIIMSETIKKLKQNSKISVVYQNAEAHHEEYRKVLRMIQDVADCLIDQNKKISLEKLIKETKTVFDRLYDELKYLKENKKFEEIDTQEGLISILEVSKLIKEYKDKILLVRKKFESTHRQIIMTPIKMEQVTQDKETDFINCVISLSKKINNSDLKDRIQHVSCFSYLSQQVGLSKMVKQIEQENILEDITAISNEFLELQEKNILERFFGPLRLENLIFKESIVMLEIKKLSSKTKQKNIISQLGELLNKRNQWIEKHKRISPQMKRYFERILADSLVRGLKQEDIKQIQNPRSIQFPTKQAQIQALRSKAKYRHLLFDQIEKSVLQTTKSIQIEGNQKDENCNSKNEQTHNKFNFWVSQILQQNINNINNFIDSFTKIQEIKKNLNSEYFIAKEYLFEFSQKLFSMICLQQPVKESENQGKKSILSWVKSLIQICSDRILFLTRAILEEENDWRLIQNKKSQDKSFEENKFPIHIEKVIELLNFYKTKTINLAESSTKALEAFNEPIENVQNPKEFVHEYSKLSLYGKLLISVVKYLKETQQIFHVILDSSKSPIALLNPAKNSLKHVFPGLKKGKELTFAQIEKISLTIPKIGIELKIKKPKTIQTPKTSAKAKVTKKPSQIMDQEIIQAEQSSMKQQMVDEIPSDNIEEMDDFQDQMPEEQMGQELNEQPTEEMIQDFQAPQDQVNDDIKEQNLQEMLEESSNLGKSKNKAKSKNQIDEFEEYDWQENAQKSKKQNQQKQQEQKTKQQKAKQEEQKKKKQDQAKKKQQEEKEKKAQQKQQQQKEKRMKRQHIKFSQTEPPKKILQHSVYEILSFVTSLSQLKNLISYLSSFGQSYMKKHIQWSKIQHYFNNHSDTSGNQTKQALEKLQKDVEKYIKDIDQEVDSKLKKDFQSQPAVFNQLKGLETVKQLKKDLLLLKNGNWQTLEKMLLLNRVSYNILKISNSVHYISIKDPSIQYNEYGSISGYLSKKFKYYKKTQFDVKGFAEKCFNLTQIGAKSDECRIVCYMAKSQGSLIQNSAETEKTFQKLRTVLENFADGAKDHINKFDLCLDLYKKALKIKQKVQLDLNWYSDQIKFLQKSGTDQKNMLSYVTFIKDNIKNVIKNIKSLESKLYNISFKCERNTIFECFEQICELYGNQIQTKSILKKGQHNFTVLMFDKTNYKENLNKIKNIIMSEPTSEESHVQKIILSLIIGSGADIPKEIDQSIILGKAKDLKTKQYELLLEIVSTLRVDHSYILIKDKPLQFFTISKEKDECISIFLKKITGIVFQSKPISSLLASNEFFTPLKSLLESSDNSFYQSIFIQSKIKNLFKENSKQNNHLKQVEVIVDEEYFDLRNKNWKEQSQRLIKQVNECVGSQKKQLNKLLSNMKKLKPCKLIYEKHLSEQKSAQIVSLWQEYQSGFKKTQKIANALISTNHWIFSVNSILTELKDEVIGPINQHLNAIDALISTSAKIHSLQQIQTEIKNTFEWVKGLVKRESKHKFLVVTLQTQSVLYFDLNINAIDLQYFGENFNFITQKNNQLKEFLFKILFSHMSLQKSEDAKKNYNLQSTDVLYQINAQKLSSSVLAKISESSSLSHHQKRHKTIREFVRTFNKLYFVSKTSKNINFKQESQILINLQNEIKMELKELEVIYNFKTFISMYGPVLWKGNSELLKLSKVFENEFLKNEKIPNDEISDILTKLEKIKVNKNSHSIDSYDAFFAWVYHTVMSLLKLPFYNVITHTIFNSQSKGQTEFLAVVVTQKSTDPGETNEQLENCLKEMFAFTEHKPIYLKENDLTVQLTKEPAFIQLTLTIKDLQLKQIVSFLNQSYAEEDQSDLAQIKKELYLRVDELREKINSKGKSEEQQIFLKLIPLQDFLKSSQQQFNLEIDQQKLCSSIECNIVYAPSQITPQIDLKKFLPINGSSVDTFYDVYMGKHLKLEKLKDWLYQFYKNNKNAVDQKRKQIELEKFCNQFIAFHRDNVPPPNKQALQKLIKNMSFESINKSKIPSKEKILFLSASSLMKQECGESLNQFYKTKYESRQQVQKLYDSEIKELIQKIQSEFHVQLYLLEGKIKANMVKKIKKRAVQKVKQIEKNYQVAQQKEKLAQNKPEQQNVNLPDENKPSEQPQQINSIEPTALVIDKQQQQRKMLEELRNDNFSEYLSMVIQLKFQNFGEKEEKNLMDEILNHFKEKISKCEHTPIESFNQQLKTQISKSYEGKTQKFKEKVLFMNELLQNNQIAYAELYLSDHEK